MLPFVLSRGALWAKDRLRWLLLRQLLQGKRKPPH